MQIVIAAAAVVVSLASAGVSGWSAWYGAQTQRDLERVRQELSAPHLLPIAPNNLERLNQIKDSLSDPARKAEFTGWLTQPSFVQTFDQVREVRVLNSFGSEARGVRVVISSTVGIGRMSAQFPHEDAQIRVNETEAIATLDRLPVNDDFVLLVFRYEPTIQNGIVQVIRGDENMPFSVQARATCENCTRGAQ